jgi:hypothetical protein
MVKPFLIIVIRLVYYTQSISTHIHHTGPTTLLTHQNWAMFKRGEGWGGRRPNVWQARGDSGSRNKSGANLSILFYIILVLTANNCK